MIIPYLGLLFFGLVRPAWLHKADEWGQSILDQASPCCWITWLKRFSFYRDFDVLVILFLALMTYFGTGVPDFANYEAAYSKMQLGIPYQFLGTGWYLVMNLGMMLGISYAALKALVILVSFVLISNTVRYYVKAADARILIWSLYLIFPALLDCVQARFLLASSLIFYALRFLGRFSWKNVLLYTLFLLGAVLIHTSALFYGLLYGVYVLQWLPHLSHWLIGAAVVIITLGKDWLVKLASLVLDAERVNRYFNQAGIGLVGMAVCTVLVVGLLFLCMQIMRADKNRSRKPAKIEKLALQVCWLMLLILPLLRFDPNFFRLQRPAWLIVYMAAGLWLMEQQKQIHVKWFRQPLFWGLLVLVILANLYLQSLFTPVINLEFLL